MASIQKIKRQVKVYTGKLGQRVRERRREFKLTIAELSKIAHVSSTVITDLENGRSLPKVYVLAKLFNALQMESETFLPKVVNYSDTAERLEDLLMELGVSAVSIDRVMHFIRFELAEEGNRK